MGHRLCSQSTFQGKITNLSIQPVIYGHDSLYVSSFVFCHECGARGVEGHVYDDSDVAQLEAAAGNVWSDRNERHRDLYVSSQG